MYAIQWALQINKALSKCTTNPFNINGGGHQFQIYMFFEHAFMN